MVPETVKKGITSAYIHIPFCLSKCRYCAFNSVPAPDPGEIERYCRALERELRMASGETGNIETTYFGGGTPTALETRQIARLLEAVMDVSGVRGPAAEITIEANPETADPNKLAGLYKAGFNRLSLGVQSFDDARLRFLGRAHDGRRAAEAFRQARRAGFGNIGMDLIYGIPGQTLENWRSDIVRAVELDPEHISSYSLAFEPGTELTAWRDQGRIKPCAEDLETEMFLSAIAMLEQAGYEHYEVSNFAKKGRRSRHNLNYWRCGDYLGFGAGAHSHLGGKRRANVNAYSEYIEKIEKREDAVGYEEELTREQKLFEAVFLGLRMVQGIDIPEFEARWGMSPRAYKPEVWHRLESQALVETRKQRTCFTRKGMLIADLCLSDFAP